MHLYFWYKTSVLNVFKVYKIEVENELEKEIKIVR